MLQKVLKIAKYAAAVLVCKIMLFCSNYAKNYASTIRQGLGTNNRFGIPHLAISSSLVLSLSILLCEKGNKRMNGFALVFLGHGSFPLYFS